MDLFQITFKKFILHNTFFQVTNVLPWQTGWLWCLSRNFNGMRESTTPIQFNSTKLLLCLKKKIPEITKTDQSLVSTMFQKKVKSKNRCHIFNGGPSWQANTNTLGSRYDHWPNPFVPKCVILCQSCLMKLFLKKKIIQDLCILRCSLDRLCCDLHRGRIMPVG